MDFEWDENKNRSNQRKHGISFEVAVEAFYDPLEITEAGDVLDGEMRWITLGLARLAVLYVVHTERRRDGEPVIRIISARPSTKSERRRYERNGRKVR